MTLLSEIAEQLIEHEGFRSKVYEDSVGCATIGYGRNVRDVGISRQEARILLFNDIEYSIQSAKKEVYWPKLNQVRRKVIIDMIFNLGYSKFKRFKRVRAALRDSQWEAASRYMRQSKWYQQVGRRGERLSKMMYSGKDVR